MNELSEHGVSCPYCGEPNNVLVDPEEIGQNYIEDCQVCCRPMVFNISLDHHGDITISVQSENEAW